MTDCLLPVDDPAGFRQQLERLGAGVEASEIRGTVAVDFALYRPRRFERVAERIGLGDFPGVPTQRTGGLHKSTIMLTPDGGTKEYNLRLPPIPPDRDADTVARTLTRLVRQVDRPVADDARIYVRGWTPDGHHKPHIRSHPSPLQSAAGPHPPRDVLGLLAAVLDRYPGAFPDACALLGDC